MVGSILGPVGQSDIIKSSTSFHVWRGHFLFYFINFQLKLTWKKMTNPGVKLVSTDNLRGQNPLILDQMESLHHDNTEIFQTKMQSDQANC